MRIFIALLVLMFAAGACGAATPTGAPVAATDSTPSSTPPPGATAPPATARPSAVGAIEMTFEPASQPPAGAIELVLTVGPTTPIFVPDEITAPAGAVVLFLTNPGLLGEFHDFQFGTERGITRAETRPIRPGESLVATFEDLSPGNYVFWCKIANHDRLGMVGTLTVEP